MYCVPDKVKGFDVVLSQHDPSDQTVRTAGLHQEGVDGGGVIGCEDDRALCGDVFCAEYF